MSLDKFKIKEQFSDLKSQLEQQKNELPPQTRVLVSTLVQLFELLIMVFEERFTRKNSNNSSIPPSKDKSKQRKTRRFASSAQRPNLPDPLTPRSPDEIVDLYPDFCNTCGLELEGKSKGYESRQVLDIVVEQYITEYRSHQRTCPCCDYSQRAPFPAGIIAQTQYGPTVKALAIAMLYAQMSSYSRTQVMLMELIGRSLSSATLVGFVRSLYNKLETWEQWAISELLNSDVMHADETGFNLNGTNAWIHVLSNPDIVVMKAHAKRGTEAIDDIGIIPKFGGILVHDFWVAYYQYDELDHAACGAHLLRELEFIIEAHGHNWARLMHQVLLDANDLVHKRKKDRLLEREFKNIQRRYRIAVTKGAAECPTPKGNGKRGRVAKTKAGNLLERFANHEQEILRFAQDSRVPFTNNLAERDLRMIKVKENVSGFFRSMEGAQAFCRIRSYLLTQWRKGVPPIHALKMAIEGQANPK